MIVTLSSQNEPQFELVDEPELREPEDDEDEGDDAGDIEEN